MKRNPLAVLALLAFVAFPLAAAPEYPSMGADIYDTKADATKQIADALKKAEVGHRRVLLMFGANWCIWCHRLHATFEHDTVIAMRLGEKFEVVLINVNTRNGPKRNVDVNERYGNPIPHGLPVLVVLDASGKQLTTQDTGELESGDQHDPKKVLAFLERWTPKSN